MGDREVGADDRPGGSAPPRRGPRGGASSRRGRSPYVVAAVAAAAVSGAVAITQWASRPPAKPRPDLPETAPTEPVPEVVYPRTEDERIQRVLDVLFSGDTEDASWARSVLFAGGESVRAAVAETARRCLVSNRAFVEHAFDVLLRDPRPEDVPLALEALGNPDPEVVKRACLLLGRVGGPTARGAIRRIADVAEMAWPLPIYAIDAVVGLGGDEAVTELERVATSPQFDEGVRDRALAALGRIGGERARTILRRELDLATEDDRIVAAADGLVEMKDPAPIARLRTMWQLAGDERALTLLARAADDVAFAEIEQRLRSKLETEQRRVHALALLATYPPERRSPLLRTLADPRNPLELPNDTWRELRVEAWASLWKLGDPADRDDLGRMLRSGGASAREDRLVAALVLGQVKDASLTKALLVAEAANRDDAEIRSILLRAMALVGDPATAETVVLAMATDPAGHLATQSVAYEVSLALANSPQPFLTAAGPHVLAAVEGRVGSPGPAARSHLVRAAARCCGPEAAPAIERLLTDDDRHVREAAAEALVWVSRPESVAALRNAWWRRQDGPTRAAIRSALERIPLVRPVR